MARQTAYTLSIKRLLRDPMRWPAFPTPHMLERLEKVAERALARRTVEGNLAAIMVLCQLMEQMARLLIADSQFLTQVASLPVQVSFREQRKQTLGGIVELLSFGVAFPHKAPFLRRATAMNALRNTVAHALVQRGSLRGISQLARRANTLHDEAIEHFDFAHDWFREAFRSYRKDMELF